MDRGPSQLHPSQTNLRKAFPLRHGSAAAKKKRHRRTTKHRLRAYDSYHRTHPHQHQHRQKHPSRGLNQRLPHQRCPGVVWPRPIITGQCAVALRHACRTAGTTPAAATLYIAGETTSDAGARLVYGAAACLVHRAEYPAIRGGVTWELISTDRAGGEAAGTHSSLRRHILFD